ncbi:uncharacterized protein LOC113771000 [Coffea eugenioides]|uniref:uncharacterized protein LOC113771000 n=1 Tax=Coffea eugenioides TaxID=49369 RepID=UPI000F609B77|nr:uncharacterized protein LOC113771000 [Coffea eugenioides]
MVIGDFNVISTPDERIGGSPPNLRNMEEFNDSMFRCGLSAMDFDGSQFTWTNGSLWQRLDRALTNDRWLASYPVSKVSHLARGRSDHSPLLVKCGLGTASPFSFRFLNVWARYPGFFAVVSAIWEMEVSGVGMPRFFKKLGLVKKRLREWSRETFGDIPSRVKAAEAIYRQREEDYDRDRDDISRSRLNEARATYTRELATECEFWRQKSAVKWLREGDANTSYFHSVVRQRRSSNFIARIRGAEGCWCDTGQQIKESATDFFSTLFTSEAAFRGNFPALPFELPQAASEHNAAITAVPSAEEIRQIVFSMEVNSAPGPDGFGVGFYRSCWGIIQEDLVAAIQDFFKGASQPRGWSSSLLVLIPKVEGACHWRDFRPISLCNVSSKIISKLLAARIGKVLPALISPWQTGFVPGRGISDNILLAQELALDLDRRLKEPNLIFKLDMEKAYDRVEWPFLLFMLRQFGLSEQVVDLCYRTFSNAWFSVLINGEPSGYFKSSRGVRQGDSLSPALFLFVAEFLGRGIHNLFLEKESRFYVSAGSRVPYLAFADDILIFTRCSSDALTAIRQFLEHYQTWSGQKVNVGKSSFTPSSRMSLAQKELVRATLGYREIGLPIRYLGVPLVKGRISCVAFEGILAKIRQQLFHWSSKLLSMGGKITLIRHVLSSIPIHLLQVLQPPKAIIVAWGRICNAFLWDHSSSEKRIHWAAWEKVCFPVAEGGLGCRSLDDVVKAFSCKLWWKLRKKDTAWAEFMHYKYIKGSHPALVRVVRPPALWRRLEGIREFAEGRIRWCLGEGLVDFWHDRWCTEEPLASLLDVTNKPCVLVGELYLHRGWDVARLRQWLPEAYVSLVLQQQIFPDLQDQMVWEGSVSGEFTIVSAVEDLRRKGNTSLVSKYIWSSALPKKMSFFVWRLLRKWIPVDVQLQRKGVFLGSRCPCCSGARETAEHLFVGGPVAAVVWGHFGRQFGILRRGVQGVSSLLMSWFLSHRKVSENHIRVLVPIAALWFLWRARNQARFEGSPMAAESIIWQVGHFIELLGKAQKLGRAFSGDRDCIWAGGLRGTGSVHRPALVAWIKPPSPVLKLNTDACVTAAGAFGGGVVRSSEGKMIFAFYKEFGEASVVHAEALAVLTGLLHCQEMRLTRVRAESDSLALVQMVNSGVVARWPLCNVLRRIRHLLMELGATVTHVFREANMVADALASLQVGHDMMYLSEDAIPRRIKTLLRFDTLNIPHVRV